MPRGGASIWAQSYRVTQAPYAPSKERRGEREALTQRVFWDWENIVTPFKPITLSKTLLQCTEGQCIMVSRRTWGTIKKHLSSLRVLSTLKNGSLKLWWREQGTEKRDGGLKKNTALLVPLCLQCRRHSSFHRKPKMVSESPSLSSLAPAGLLSWYYTSQAF